MERKGQIFFFGRPGCLKQSIPIRVSEEEEAEKKNDDSVALGGNNESQKPTHTSDDDTDGDELMKRISEVLEDEPGISQNHNDKSNDLKSTENCEKVSPVNNNDHKENNDNMLSALETLSENNENVVELNESVNSEAIISNAIEKCSEEKIISNSEESTDESCQERHEENLVKSDDKIDSEEKVLLNENQISSSIEEVPMDVEAQSSKIDKIEESNEEVPRNESEAVDSSASKIPEISETEPVELPEISEKVAITDVSKDELEDISTSNAIEGGENDEKLSEIPLPTEVAEEPEEMLASNEEQSEEINPPTEIIGTSKENSASISDNEEKFSEPVDDNDSKEIEPSELEKSSEISESIENESQIISNEPPIEPNKTQEISPEIETSDPIEETCIPEKCDTESNQVDVDVNNSNLPESSTMTQLITEEIESKPETIETSENTQNIESETTSITEVLDSNKIDESNEENSEKLYESNEVETFESENENDSEIPSKSNKVEENEPENIEDSKISKENVLDDVSLQPSSETSELLEEHDKNEPTNDEETIVSDSPENSSHKVTSDFKLVTYDESSSEDATVLSLDDNKSENEPTNDEKITSEIIKTPINISEESHGNIEEKRIENTTEASKSSEPKTSTSLIDENSSELSEEKTEEAVSEIIEEKPKTISQEIQTSVSDDVTIREKSDDIKESLVESVNETEELEISPEAQEILHSNIPKETEDTSAQQDENLEKPQTENVHEDDNESISSIEEHKGVEISEPKSEDISIAEEALPKEEISIPQAITQESDEDVPEISVSAETPTEIENEILPQENTEEFHDKSSLDMSAEIDETSSIHNTLKKSPEVSIENEAVSEEIESELKGEEISQTAEISSEPEPLKKEETYSEVQKQANEIVENVPENLQPEEPQQEKPVEVSKPAEISSESTSLETEVLDLSQVESKLEKLSQNEKICSEIQKESVEAPPCETAQLETKSDETPQTIEGEETPTEIEPIEKVPISRAVTRKRKISERKSISESDSDNGSQLVCESVSQDPESDVEEAVQRKKPRIRGKITPRRKLPTRHSARVEEAHKNVVVEPPEKSEEKPEENDKKEEEGKTLQNLKFDYDENEDVAANVAAIKTLICKDTDPLKTENEDVSSDDESVKKKAVRPGRKAKRGRPVAKKVEAQASSSEDEDTKSTSKMPDSKRSKTSESNEPSPKEPVTKKREKRKGLLRDLDTSLVIETIDNEAPVRASRRIAQQKIKEETDRRLMEEKLLKQMKAEAEKKKNNVTLPLEDEADSERDSDDSYKGDAKKKKKKKMKPTDPSKPWQTSSSHSEHSESEIDEYEHHEEDPGSPLFRSDHEFSPESEDDSTPVQPIKRARTAKKQVEESSDEEDVNTNHACQVCHKTDSPEWILLCDGCDYGYHCSCLKPIIFCIPSGNWYCPLCCHKKLITDLGVQLEQLDILVETIQVEEMRKQKQIEAQKLTEISEQNILNDRRKNREGEKRRRKRDDDKESSRNEQSSENDESESNDDSSSSDNSSDNAPLIYKLRKRNQATASYRFNDYDELINSAIRDEMEEVKGLGNAGRGKDISTIIEADKEEKKQHRLEMERGAGIGEKKMPSDEEKGDDAESSGSEIGRNKKSIQRKKKMRKLNALEDTSEGENSDDDFKGSSSSNSDTEDYSASSVSESSLDLPRKKGKAAQRSMRSGARNRRYDEKFIDDQSSDDEPLIKKRNKKKSSDEEDYDLEDDGSGSTAEEVDSSDLCDDTETDSSQDNFPRKKKRVASYDKKPRKPAKKFDEDDDKAFRAGISKKKILEKRQEENESDGSGSEKVSGRRKTRGKKLLYIMEDDFESDDGIKPGVGVVRPETPPEEREMFRKKQEEIKKMLAAKNTEGAKKLAVPTIEPLNFDIEKPKSPSLPPIAESSSLSTIPKDVIQGAKALDFDYNRIKPVTHSTSKANELQPEMSEEELAKMMEEEDFAQHQLKLAGEAIRKQQAILELEGKEEAFSAFTKKKDEKPLDVPTEPKKRAKKPKVEKALNESVKAPIAEIQKSLPEQLSRPPLTIPQTQTLHSNHPMSSVPPPLISSIHHQPSLHAPYSNLPPSSRFALNPNQPIPPHNLQERPSVLSSLMAGHPRPEMLPQFHRQMPPESFIQKGPPHLPPAHLQQQIQPLPSQADEKEKKGRRKKFTPLRQDLPEANVPKVAKLDTPPTSSTTSVIHTNLPVVDDKNKGLPPALQRTGKAAIAVASPAQIFNPGTSPTPSVITRLIQPPPQNSPQQRLGPYGFSEHDNAPSQPPTNRAYPSTDEIKHLAAASTAASKQSRPSPQAPFNEIPFVPRTMHHTLYRAPPTSQTIYGIPPHARLPYPFHLPPHPNNNLRPQDYASSPYGIPPQFAAAYYGAPPAHRPPNSNSTTTPLNHPENFHHPGAQPPRVGDPENPQQQATPSEFGGLVSYFSSQQELD